MPAFKKNCKSLVIKSMRFVKNEFLTPHLTGQWLSKPLSAGRPDNVFVLVKTPSGAMHTNGFWLVFRCEAAAILSSEATKVLLHQTFIYLFFIKIFGVKIFI